MLTKMLDHYDSTIKQIRMELEEMQEDVLDKMGILEVTKKRKMLQYYQEKRRGIVLTLGE